ncbi:MAG: FkbM family methyltransferase [Thermodesulfobacteriota bacterium]
MTWIKRFLTKRLKISFSQAGEDLIVSGVMKSLRISQPYYLDIGAHHPTTMNNTYLFYLKGSRGVCVEPDPDMFSCLRSKRGKDVCLNFGIGPENRSSADFYVMTTKSLSTFSKADAERYQTYGNQRILQVIQIPIISINDLLQQYLKKCPDFVSLDVEGLEPHILRSLDLSRYRPPVFCIETLTYTEDKSEQKLTNIIDYMRESSYMPYADTYVNTIFVDVERWQNRP